MPKKKAEVPDEEEEEGKSLPAGWKTIRNWSKAGGFKRCPPELHRATLDAAFSIEKELIGRFERRRNQLRQAEADLKASGLKAEFQYPSAFSDEEGSSETGIERQQTHNRAFEEFIRTGPTSLCGIHQYQDGWIVRPINLRVDRETLRGSTKRAKATVLEQTWRTAHAHQWKIEKQCLDLLHWLGKSCESGAPQVIAGWIADASPSNALGCFDSDKIITCLAERSLADLQTILRHAPCRARVREWVLAANEEWVPHWAFAGAPHLAAIRCSSSVECLSAVIIPLWTEIATDVFNRGERLRQRILYLHQFTTGGFCGGHPDFGPWDVVRDVIPRMDVTISRLAALSFWNLATDASSTLSPESASMIIHIGLAMSRRARKLTANADSPGDEFLHLIASLRCHPSAGLDNGRLNDHARAVRWHLLLDVLSKGDHSPPLLHAIGDAEFRPALSAILERIRLLIGPWLLAPLLEPGLVRLVLLYAWPSHLLPPHALQLIS